MDHLQKTKKRNLAKKTDHNTRFSEIENKINTDHDDDKYITTQECNKLMSEKFTTRLAKINLANKIDIPNFVKKTDLKVKQKNKKLKQYQQKD